MKTLRREQVVSVIDGKGAAERVPLFYDIWVNPDVFGQNADKARAYLSACPCDIDLISLRMPDLWQAPADAPGYRFIHRDPPASSSAAIDSRIALPDYSELDEFIRDFPSADYPGIWDRKINGGGRYRLIHWWYWLFERHWSLRGMENALVDFYEYPDEVRRLYSTLTDFYIGLIRNGRRYYGADGVFISDDLGTQRGAFFSQKIFDEFFRPNYKRLIDAAHEMGMHVWLHCCGDVAAFLPSFVELGFDVLHPIQKYAMDEAAVARDFGDKLTVLAGFDVQRTIPFGTPDEVRAEVRHLIDTYARPDGRFLLTAGNGITGDCPIESLRALLEESLSYGTQKIRSMS